MATDHQEVEWQFDAVDLDAVEQWLTAQSTAGEVEIGPKVAKDHVDTYFDSDDWRFFRAGYGLRVRRNGDKVEVTMKALADSGAGARRRREINEDMPDAGPKEDATTLLRRAQGDVGRRMRAISGPHLTRVRPLFETHTRRRTLPLLIDGQLAAEIALDETSIPAGGRSKAVQLRRVEVEVSGDSTAAVKPFITGLRKACRLQRATKSKFQTGLEARGLAPTVAPDLGPATVDATSPVGDLAFAVMRKQLAAILAHEPGARLGDDIKDVHAMRVAVRRMRAAMNLFRDFLPEKIAAFRTEIGWVGDVLGEVRDLDVQLEQVNAWRDVSDSNSNAMTVEGSEHAGQRTVADMLSEQRCRAHDRLLAALNSRRYARLITGFGALLRNPPKGPDSAQKPVAAIAFDLIPRTYRKIRKLGDRLDEDSSTLDYHKVRIQCKQLRYGLEFVMGLYGKPAKALLERAVAVQDSIGAYHDSQVAMDKFRDMSTAPGPVLQPLAVFALRETAQRYEQQGAHVKAGLPKVYARLKGKPWKRLKKAMKAQSQPSSRLPGT